MKILVNVDTNSIKRMTEWVFCEAFKLIELPDGSFDLVWTDNLTRTITEERDTQINAAREYSDADLGNTPPIHPDAPRIA